MVHKVKTACEMAGVEFLGWTTTTGGHGKTIIRLQKGEVLSVLDLPTATFLLLDAEGLAKRIGNLFFQGSVN